MSDRLGEVGPAVDDAVPDGTKRHGIEVDAVVGKPRPHRLSAAAWSAMSLPDSPIRSMTPLALTSPDSGTSSWYFSEDDPALSTSTGRSVLVGGGLVVHPVAPCWPEADRLWACTAVIATVLTMSSTRAPRERSLTGLRSPWSTGPIATAWALRCTAL